MATGRETVIGGVGTASANVIAMNGGDGVEVAGVESVENTIRSNSIFGNGGLGIDLGPSGITPNDPVDDLDADTGSNNLQNFPHLDVESTTTTVSGDLQSASENVYTIDVYASPTCDPTGSGEGRTRVASFNMTTEENGDGTFGPQALGAWRVGIPHRDRDCSDDGRHLRVLAVRERRRWGGGGTLTGGRTTPSGTYDLTTEGSTDWAVWGFSSGGEQCNTPAPAARRSHPTFARRGGAGISNLVNINPGPAIPLRGIGFVSPQPFNFAWSSGSPAPPSETNARTGLQHNGEPPTPPRHEHAGDGLQLHRPGGYDVEDAQGLGRAQPCRRPVHRDPLRRVGDRVLGLVQRRTRRLRRCSTPSHIRPHPPVRR